MVGHNVEAAAAMGQLRAGLLALVPYATGPDDLLTELDRFAQQHRITDFATSLCVVWTPTMAPSCTRAPVIRRR
ncbi:MAG: SpoIIE family protein phosphatase [Ilumatobacteraceae bacterium]